MLPAARLEHLVRSSRDFIVRHRLEGHTKEQISTMPVRVSHSARTLLEGSSYEA
jgi:hypothetical protein